MIYITSLSFLHKEYRFISSNLMIYMTSSSFLHKGDQFISSNPKTYVVTPIDCRKWMNIGLKNQGLGSNFEGVEIVFHPHGLA